MATAAALKPKTKFESVEDFTEYSRDLGLNAARSARDAVSETTLATVDSLVAYTDTAQQMLGEFTALTLAGAKDLYALQSEASRSAFDAFGESLGKDLATQPAVVAWQKVVKAGAEALDRFAEQVKTSVAQGNEKVKDVVSTVAVQVKDSNAKLAATLEDLEQSVAKA